MDVQENGTKWAAMVANAYVKRHREIMTAEEAHALRILIAAAVKNPDAQPPTWHCDIYCRNVRHVSCEGELCAEDCAPDLCPYYDEMLY
ncbi:MAG TPA: hypothetical protein DF613_13520 [Lachnospiraceae bacterium]|nr:hypothetical protein [Lachnospiraceae bacterium]